MKFQFYVVQFGYGVFGFGDTPEAAVQEARNWIDADSQIPDADDIACIVGTDVTGAKDGRKLMTQYGELHDGQMVLIDADQAAYFGYEDVE